MKIEIINYSDLERVESDLVILKGHIDSTEAVNFLEIQIWISETQTTICLNPGLIRIVHNSFSALIPIVPGTNDVSFHHKNQVVKSIRLVHENDKLSATGYKKFVVKPLIVFSDSATPDCSNETSYFERIKIGLRIVQWYFSEKLVEAGLPRYSFSLNNCSVLKLPISPASLQNMSSTEVWEMLAYRIRSDSVLWSDNVKYVAFLLHPWKRQAALDHSNIFALEPRSAVAGGGLVLLDHKLLTTWPEKFEQIYDTMESDQKVPELGSLTPLLSTTGRQFGASLGIVAHEMGHVFDLGHESTGLMGKDFHHFALSLRPKIKSTLKGQTKRVYSTSGKICEDPVQLPQAFLTLLHYNRWVRPYNQCNSTSSTQVDSITLEKNLVKSTTRISVIQVREPETARTICSWVSSTNEDRTTFTLPKRFVPREWIEKLVEILVQNVSGTILKLKKLWNEEGIKIMNETNRVEFEKDWPSPSGDGKIPTGPFLDACEVVLQVLGSMGNLFHSVRKDVEGNVHKLKLKYNLNPTRYATLQDLILKDPVPAKPSSGDAPCATESLKWLKRGLHFVYLLLDNVVQCYEKQIEENSLMEACLQAYEIALKKYHNWVLQKFATACIRTICPNRQDFLKSLGSQEYAGRKESLFDSMKHFVNGLRINLEIIFAFYYEKGFDTVATLK